MRIVAVERRPRRKRLTITFEDGSTLEASIETVGGFGLRSGDDLSDTRLASVAEAEARHQANLAALRMIARSPQSEAEIRRKLAQRAIPHPVAAEVITRLRELGLIDDAGFARVYAERRERMSPRGRRLIAAELRGRGVSRDVAAVSIEPLDDAEAAYRAAVRRAQSLKALPYADFQRRLGEFLLRRGFGYEVAGSTIRKVWEETRDSAG